MNPDEKRLLEDTHKLAVESNQILRHMRSRARWTAAWHIFYWVVVVGLSVGAYYYIQPYLLQLEKVYKGFSSDLNNVRNVAGQVSNLGGLLNKIGK